MPDAANMSRRNVVIAIALIFGSAATTAMAQFALPGSTEQPAPLVREAFASPYGRALIAELGTVLRTDADPVCLNSKGIALDQLQPRGEAWLIKWGTRATETVMSLVDLKTYEKNFPAGAELNGLRERPEIKRYLDIGRPLRLAKVLDFIFEQFDRYNLLNRIKIAPVSPAASGKDDLLRTNPTESAEEALEDFIATHQSAQLKRYLALSEQAAAAIGGAVSKEQAIRTVPGTFYRGIELDLAELCIVPR